ncbi:hypothetical protein ACVBEQ_00280 [Nakamurella sp. GG22]
MSADAHGTAGATATPPEPIRRTGTTSRVLLLAALPAVVIGVLLRYWVGHTWLLSLNSDEALVGLQAREVLDGTFRLMVAGNDYGSTTESYLAAPLMLFSTGAWPLRLLAAALSVVAAYALFRLARLFFAAAPALAIALVFWSASGAMVILWSRPYMGYPTGIAAQIAGVALACYAMRSPRRLGRTALLAGLATGFAVWSHPMFGIVALLALIPPTVLHRTRWREWWLPVAAGGLIGVLPWIVYILTNGAPAQAQATVQATYPERLQIFATELLPRAFGLRLPDGRWLGPVPLVQLAAAVLIIGAFAGLVLLVVKKGSSALPLLVAGVLAFPCLAVFPQLAFSADARYALPFLPQLLIGLGAWLLLLPARVRESPWLVAVLPTAWALLLCVPVLSQQASWTLTDPERAPSAVVRALDDAGVQYVRGDYWATYLIDYLADGRLAVRPDFPVRLQAEAAAVDAADPDRVALVYVSGVPPTLVLPRSDYQLVQVDGYDIYLPPGLR